MKSIINSLFLVLFFVGMFACNSKPQVIEAEPTIPGDKSEVKVENPQIKNEIEENHLVEVKEVLQSNKYTYLSVAEKGETFWIAVTKQEAKVGEKYAYKGGLKKRNFESKEFDRVFETVYLVSQIIPVDGNSKSSTQKGVKTVSGSTSLADIIKNPSDFEGKEIVVVGECIKVNPQIMGRNWVHLADGTADDYDFTITTQENIPIGANVALKGIISLDIDFGAGYRYDIILQDAVLVK